MFAGENLTRVGVGKDVDEMVGIGLCVKIFFTDFIFQFAIRAVLVTALQVDFAREVVVRIGIGDNFGFDAPCWLQNVVDILLIDEVVIVQKGDA